MTNDTIDQLVRRVFGAFEDGVESERFVIVPLENGIELVHLFSGTPIGQHNFEDGETAKTVASELTSRLGTEVKLPTCVS